MSHTFSSTRPVRDITHPLRTDSWQDGPAELIAHGLQHMHLNREEFDRLMAFLLFDVGVEKLLKIFLSPDGGVTGSVTSGGKKRANFPDIVDDVRAAAPDRFSSEDKQAVVKLHRIRNGVYHNGYTEIPTEQDVRNYRDIAVRLLRDLLDIDLANFMREPDLRKEEQEAIAEKKRLVRAKLREIDEVVTDIIELLAPRLLGPRTWQWFDELFRPQLIAPLTRATFEKIFGKEAVEENDFSAEEVIDTAEHGVGALSLSDIDRFFTFAIEDGTIRDYFLTLPQEDRRSIISSLFSERSSLLMDMEMDGDDDDTYLPYRLSVLLLNNWPGWPYYEQDYRLDLAYSYPNDPEQEHPIYNERGKMVGYHWLTTDKTLALADVRLQELQPIYDELKEWLDDRTARKWSELPT